MTLVFPLPEIGKPFLFFCSRILLSVYALGFSFVFSLSLAKCLTPSTFCFSPSLPLSPSLSLSASLVSRSAVLLSLLSCVDSCHTDVFRGLTIVSVKELSAVGGVTRLAYTVESGGVGPWGGTQRAMLHDAGQYVFINVRRERDGRNGQKRELLILEVVQETMRS